MSKQVHQFKGLPSQLHRTYVPKIDIPRGTFSTNTKKIFFIQKYPLLLYTLCFLFTAFCY